MGIELVSLFLSVAIAGTVIIARPLKDESKLKNLLIFGGSYLFSLTVIHLLPELFHIGEGNDKIAYFVLFGFFLQLLLEHFSQGVEHGHIHLHHVGGFFTRPIFLLVSLSFHAILEGSLLAHPVLSEGSHHTSSPLLIGIILHKIPATVALVSVLKYSLKSERKIIIYLLIFAASSPIGLIISSTMSINEVVSSEYFIILFAIVSGNFLHISTTIFFEMNPEHSFNRKKVGVAIIGAAVAILAELII